MLGNTTMFASAILTGGVGPWLPFQMLAAGWVGLGAGVLPRRVTGRWEVALLAALRGGVRLRLRIPAQHVVLAVGDRGGHRTQFRGGRRRGVQPAPLLSLHTREFPPSGGTPGAPSRTSWHWSSSGRPCLRCSAGRTDVPRSRRRCVSSRSTCARARTGVPGAGLGRPPGTRVPPDLSGARAPAAGRRGAQGVGLRAAGSRRGPCGGRRRGSPEPTGILRRFRPPAVPRRARWGRSPRSRKCRVPASTTSSRRSAEQAG